MANITVSTDIDTFLQSADNAVARASIGADVRTDANGAFSAGDLGGNARGLGAINIQATRLVVPQVASGTYAVAIGNFTTASGAYAPTAIGKGATASGAYGTAIGVHSTASGGYFPTAISASSTASAYYSTAVGYASTASGYRATALGSEATASGYKATASGYKATASGDYSTALGRSVRTTVANTAEVGDWSSGSARAGAIRIHSTGMVAQTIQNRATAYTDGGATAGSEADNTVIRGGIALRRNGNAIYIDLNIGGTVTTLSLGTAS